MLVSTHSVNVDCLESIFSFVLRRVDTVTLKVEILFFEEKPFKINEMTFIDKLHSFFHRTGIGSW